MCGCQLRNDEHTLNYLKIMCECQRSYNALSCSCPLLSHKIFPVLSSLSLHNLSTSLNVYPLFRMKYLILPLVIDFDSTLNGCPIFTSPLKIHKYLFFLLFFVHSLQNSFCFVLAYSINKLCSFLLYFHYISKILKARWN